MRGGGLRKLFTASRAVGEMKGDYRKLKTVLSSYMLRPKADAEYSRGCAPKKWSQ